LTASFFVPLSEHTDIGGSLELFRRSGDDLIDRWDGQRLIRSAYVARGTWVPFVARAENNNGFEVTVANQSDAAHVRSVVANTFMPAPPEYQALLQEDGVLAKLEAHRPGVRQIRQLDVFTALIRCISAQQVNLRWASTTRRRLAETFGRRYEIDGEEVYALDPWVLASVDPAEIRALQFTTSKAVSIVATARAIADGDLVLDDLSSLDDIAVIERLVKIRGIGLWSAEWVLARTLGRPRVVAGDLGVRKAVGLAYLGMAAPGEAEVRETTRHWGPSAGVAQAVLLHALAEGYLTPTGQRRSPVASRA
jgi:3-methyladenine DNA glycosylase/8-oxoguanine DNA glycosylase